MPQRAFSPNPYAIAQLLLGKPVDVGDWEGARQILEDGFKVKHTALYDRDGDQPSRFRIFQDIAYLLNRPQSLAAMLDEPLVRSARELYGDEAIQRLLPFLVPIDDVAFKKPGMQPGLPTPHVEGQFVGEYRPFDTYTVDGVSYLDPVQGGIADCYLISSMIALAWTQPGKWEKVVDDANVADAAGNHFRFAFFANDSTRQAPFDVAADVPFDNRGGHCFARSSEAQEAWPSLLEKAYVMERCGNLLADPKPGDYQMIGQSGVDPQDACHTLVGGAANIELNLELRAQPQWHQLPDRCDERGVTRFPTMAWTWDDASHLQGLTFARTGLIPNHAYAVLGTMQREATRYVVLRNPHGTSMTGADQPPEYAGGSWEPGPGDPAPGSVRLNDRGVLALPMDWLNICFEAMGWVQT